LRTDSFVKLSKERLGLILKSDRLAIDEIDLFKALQLWAAAEAKRTQTDAKSAVKDLIGFIRFPTMEITQVASAVAPSGLLEQSQLVGLFSYVSVPDPSLREKMPDPGFPTRARAGGSGFTWDTKKHGHNVTLSNNNLTVTTSGSAWANSLCLGTKEFKSGNHYWEIKIDYSNDDMAGVCKPDINSDGSSVYSSCPSQVWFVHHGVGIYGGTVGTKTSVDCNSRTGDVLGFALSWNKLNSTFDMSVYKNKKLVGTPFRGIPPPVVAAYELYGSPAKATLDSKARKPT